MAKSTMTVKCKVEPCANEAHPVGCRWHLLVGSRVYQYALKRMAVQDRDNPPEIIIREAGLAERSGRRVRVTVELGTEFVAALRTQLTLHGDLARQTPLDQLGMAVMMEARGALPEQVHLGIMPEWRPHLEVVHDERRVIG